MPMSVATVCLFSLAWFRLLHAAEYPFRTPPDIEANLRINTTRTRPVDPMMLGLNCSWPEEQYGKNGYNNPDAQKLIRAFQPVALRFPHGVWANFYDWKNDGRRITDTYKTAYDSAVKEHGDLKYGFDSLNTLHTEIGFDVLFTWNVNYDSPEKGARRLLDLREKGFKADHIELGNEIFWKTQRSEAVSTEAKYLAVSKAHATALKAIDPSIKVSVPVHWRDAMNNPWNLALKNESYFDAISVHKYIQGTGGENESAAALSARQEILAMAAEMNEIFPGKPIWLSEWGVRCEDQTISTLGVIDTWLAILEHPESFSIADFFQMNAEHPLIHYDRKASTHTRTGIGAAYEILRSVFDGAEILDSRIDSTKIGDDLNGVSAMATLKDGEIAVLAINLTDREASLKIESQGGDEPTNTVHEVSFPKPDQFFQMDQEPLEKIEDSGSGITLPPLSINRIRFPHP